MNSIAAWDDFVYTCGIGDSLRQSNRMHSPIITLVQDQKKAFSLAKKAEQ